MKPLTGKILFLFLLGTGCFGLASAQTKLPAVSGSLVNAQGKPMDYTTVSLLSTKDSSVVAGTLTNEAGLYKLDHIKAGTYMIKAFGVGYLKAMSQPFTVNGVNVNVPVLTMQTATLALNTVNVTSAKPLIEHQAGKTVMNVAGSILAAGNTAMDILERAPGVTIDKDDNISLKGKQGVTVMINDKLTYLSSTQLATLLRSTDGGSIQSIEIISNPSAKYDAAGNSGIINIKLKKNKQVGTNGTFIAGAGVGTYVKDNESISLNHKDGNLNVFGGFNRGDNPHGRIININRTVVDSGKATYFKQRSFMPEANHYNSYNIGADYDISPKNTIGFAVNGYFNNNNQRNLNRTNIYSNPANAPDSSQITTSAIPQTYKNVTVDLNETYKIDTLGQELAFDLDYSKFNNSGNAHYDTYFTPATGYPAEAPVFIRNQTPSTIDIRAAKVDYTYMLSKSIKLETGGKFSDVKTDNDLEAQKQDIAGVFVNDTTRTNRFIYDEKIGAAYVNLTKTYKNTSVEFGLRAEYTASRGDLVTQDSVAQRKYLNLFPSLFINHTFNDKNELDFSYSRRIDRPDYENLNPFVYYLDQYTYSKGNPFLKPQYTNNFELDYTYNKTINLSLNYSHTIDEIQEIILTDVAQKASYETHLNINSQDSYSANLNTPFTITKWWTGNLDVNAFYLKFKSDTLFGGNLDKGQAAYGAKLTQTFVFAGFKAELYGNYQSALTYGVYEIKPRYNVDAGVSRSFDNKKMNLKFSVSDIFNTRTNDLDINYQSDIISIRQKSETRVARLTFTYNFGNSSIKKREHSTAVDDEKQRAGGN